MILSLCPPLPTPEEMAAWDRAAMDLGLSEAVLMENAGREAVAALRETFGPVAGRRALVLAGPGNNGGDAFVAARLLACAGAAVATLHLAPRKRYRGAAAANLRLAARLGLPLTLLTPESLARESAPAAQPDILVDGLFGTGFAGPLRENARRVIEAANALGARAFVLALDIPSGLSGLTGEPSPVALRADLTAAFHAAKLGSALPAAAPWVGKLAVRDIGIPPQAVRAAPAGCFQLGPAVRALLPSPDPALHKGQAGHVLVVGGSPGLSGAPLLAALGALRGGAGLATVACPADLAPEIRSGFPEVMTLPLGGGRDWTPAMARELAPHLSRFDALALGPGLGRSEGAAGFLAALPAPLPRPTVLDADALHWLAEEPSLRGLLPPACILTPHPGEAGRLAGATARDIQADRPVRARTLAADLGRVTVLKGAGTLAADPGGALLLCPLAAPCLAVAGSGDVLAGLAASLLARGLSPLDAAGLATYWHGSTGILLGRDFPGRGNLAREIADALPRALEEMRPC
ncbi:MAG: NAD(P)H-hydrate dehydratase [Thermodesulfobacteriota bacterium]